MLQDKSETPDKHPAIPPFVSQECATALMPASPFICRWNGRREHSPSACRRVLHPVFSRYVTNRLPIRC